MAGRVLNFDDPVHEEVDALLPWLVNGTLAGEALARVERHVQECPRCQRELAWQRELQSVYVASEPVPEASDSFARLRRRIEHSQSKRSVPTPRVPAFWHGLAAWAPWAAAIEMGVILALGVVLLSGKPPAGGYRTLGAPGDSAAVTGTLVVEFAPQITEEELRSILRAVDARIVDGPTDADAYVLSCAAGRRAAVLKALRAQRAVVLAQPLAADAAR